MGELVTYASYFSMAVIRHHGQGKIIEERFNWGYGPRVHSIREAWQQAVGMVAENAV